jgi:hypothetical protein
MNIKIILDVIHFFSSQMIQYIHVKLNKKNCHGKSSIQQEEDSFHQQIGLKFKEVTSKVLHLEHSFVWYCNLGHFGKLRNTWKVLKCGAGEGWRRSFGPIA